MELLTTEEAAAFLKKSAQALRRWRTPINRGPRWTKIGRDGMYDLSDLEQWVRDHSRETERPCDRRRR